MGAAQPPPHGNTEIIAGAGCGGHWEGASNVGCTSRDACTHQLPSANVSAANVAVKPAIPTVICVLLRMPIVTAGAPLGINVMIVRMIGESVGRTQAVTVKAEVGKPRKGVTGHGEVRKERNK